MDGPGILYLLVALVALFAGWTIITKALQRSRQARETWRTFAAAKGLQQQRSGFPATTQLRGFNQGFPFLLERVVRRRGNSNQTFTHVHLSLPDLPPGLRIARRSSLRKLVEILGARNIETGDDQFDQVFVVTGRDPENVRRFLTPERRHALRGFLQELEHLRINEDGIHWERRGLVRDLGMLERLYARLGELALTLCAAHY
jgi:hypothetical protein